MEVLAKMLAEVEAEQSIEGIDEVKDEEKDEATVLVNDGVLQVDDVLRLELDELDERSG